MVLKLQKKTCRCGEEYVFDIESQQIQLIPKKHEPLFGDVCHPSTNSCCFLLVWFLGACIVVALFLLTVWGGITLIKMLPKN
jgi:hypothetical protein